MNFQMEQQQQQSQREMKDVASSTSLPSTSSSSAPTVVIDQPWYDPIAQCTALYRGLWHNGQPMSHGVAVYEFDNDKDEIKVDEDQPWGGRGQGTANGAKSVGCDWKLYEGCWSSSAVAVTCNSKLESDGDATAAIATVTESASAAVAHFDGHGRLVYRNDDVYTGNFSCSQRHGTGTYHWHDGSGRTYTGEWRHNQRHGHGVFTYRNDSNDYYKGEFVNGQRCGYGTFVFGATGASYTGQWYNGLYHGQGTTVDEYGNVYTGLFCDGHPVDETSSSSTITPTPKPSTIATDSATTREDNNMAVHDAIDDVNGTEAPSLARTGITSTTDETNTLLAVRAPPPAAAPPPPPPSLEHDSKTSINDTQVTTGRTTLQLYTDNPKEASKESAKEEDSSKVSVVVDFLTTDKLSCPGHYTGMVIQVKSNAVAAASLSQPNSIPLQPGSPLYSTNSHVGTLVPHGVGRMVYSDQSRIHEGFWQFGAKHGHGRCWFLPQHDIHEGDYVNNVRHGKGRYTWGDGRHYHGMYANDERQGHGVFSYPNGERYEGTFHKGVRSGVGRFDFIDSGILSPATSGTTMSTVPSTTSTSATTLTIRTTTANSMGRYQGEWHNGKYHGQGCIVWNSIGQSYTGEFVAGQLHGQGVLKRIGGRTDEILLEGQWIHGMYQQQADPAATSSYPPPTASAITEMHDDNVEDTGNLSVPTADMESLVLSVKDSGLGDV